MFHDIYLLIELQKIAVGMFLHPKTQVKTRRQAEISGFILFSQHANITASFSGYNEMIFYSMTTNSGFHPVSRPQKGSSKHSKYRAVHSREGIDAVAPLWPHSRGAAS